MCINFGSFVMDVSLFSPFLYVRIPGVGECGYNKTCGFTVDWYVSDREAKGTR